MPSSRDALKLAAYGSCSRCGEVKFLYGKRLRLCHDCAAEGDYWTESSPEADMIETALDALYRGGVVNVKALHERVTHEALLRYIREIRARVQTAKKESSN